MDPIALGLPEGLDDDDEASNKSPSPPRATEKAKANKLPMLIKKVKAVNALRMGSAVVGARVQWDQSVREQDRLSTRIAGLRQKSRGLGFDLPPHLLDDVFGVDVPADQKEVELERDRNRKKKEEAQAAQKKRVLGVSRRPAVGRTRRVQAGSLPLGLDAAPFSSLPPTVQRRLGKEHQAGRKKELTTVQKVAAAAKKKADEGIVIEEQVGGMPTIDPNEKDFDKMTTRELRNVRQQALPVCSEHCADPVPCSACRRARSATCPRL